MDELIKAVHALLSDIESMRCTSPDNFTETNQWFGPFGEHSALDYDEGTIVVEWPNLAISAAAVKSLLSKG